MWVADLTTGRTATAKRVSCCVLLFYQADIASSYGLVVQADDIKIGFKRAFKEISEAHPLYGKFSTPPLHYEDWWSSVIERTFQYANVADSGRSETPALSGPLKLPDRSFMFCQWVVADLQIALPTLLPDLIEHFASRKGYTIHDDVLPCLQELQNTDLKMGIISNSDPRTMKVLESLGIVPEYISPEKLVASCLVHTHTDKATIFQLPASPPHGKWAMQNPQRKSLQQQAVNWV